ncbi:MAG TPA: DNA primase [Candidatus Omnitrophota bacterium]|nr:DNA primase [Candidatus Omnitrophota bacterium]HPS37657.1 DNA primase [Candidatus Omnitrophota bacterium]
MSSVPGATRYEENVVEQVSAANDIVEIISQYVPLKRSGRHLKACCPFHGEKTPSFMVQAEKQLFHCFGCGAGGDVFSFLMRHENMTFPEALKFLADRAHITLPERRGSKEDSGIKEKMYEACQRAAELYHQLLLKEPGAAARAYLAKRQVSDEIIREFKLGWAPQEWRTLYDHLKKKGYSEEFLKQAALIQQSPKGNYYDTFRGRLIFPIQNLQNKIIAFGGRLIGDAEGPKYLNSPETPVFSKRRELFGLNLAKKFIDRDWPNLILVEGYMDFLALYQHGFKNAVATLGTALGEDHVRLMKRFVEEVTVVYDGDKAGEAASLRGLEILLEGGMQVKLVSLPKGEDPDDFLHKHGIEAFAKLLKGAKDLFDYKLHILMERYPRHDTLGLTKISREMFETFLKVKNTVVLSDYFTRLARALNVDENSLRTEFGNLGKKMGSSKERPKERAAEPVAAESPKTELPAGEELMVLVLMAEVPPFCERAMDALKEEDLKVPVSREIFRYLGEAYEAKKKISVSTLLNRIQDLKYREQFVAVMASLDETAERERILDDCIRKVLRNRITGRLEELRRLISAAELKGDEAAIRVYTQEYQELYPRSKSAN